MVSATAVFSCPVPPWFASQVALALDELVVVLMGLLLDFACDCKKPGLAVVVAAAVAANAFVVGQVQGIGIAG